MKKKLDDLFKKEINDEVSASYQKLISFVDAAMIQSFNMSGDERASFLIKNMLNMRDFLSSEVLIEKTKLDVRSSVVTAFDTFIKEAEIDLEEIENQIEEKKKKKELELLDKELPLEALLELDPKT
jgi:hypothetical protein